MTLTDAGPLVALINSGDQHHSACAAAYPQLATPLLTTWPCLAEAMHLLQRHGGYRYQAALWSMHFRGQLALHQLTRAETACVAELMEQYRDTPMDLADASLVAVAESRSLRQAFTVDRQFYIYRLNDGSALDVVP